MGRSVKKLLIILNTGISYDFKIHHNIIFNILKRTFLKAKWFIGLSKLSFCFSIGNSYFANLYPFKTRSAGLMIDWVDKYVKL